VIGPAHRDLAGLADRGVAPASSGPSIVSFVTTRSSAWNTGRPTLPALRIASAASRQHRIDVSVWPKPCFSTMPRSWKPWI
jgi:hypothetical protein